MSNVYFPYSRTSATVPCWWLGWRGAVRKIAALRSGVHCTVGSPELADELPNCSQERIEYYAVLPEHWLDDVWLVVAATDDSKWISTLPRCRSAAFIVNVVDDAELSSYQVVGVERGP